jgi:hypothetical protein
MLEWIQHDKQMFVGLASIIYIECQKGQAACPFGETIMPQASQPAEKEKNHGR